LEHGQHPIPQVILIPSSHVVDASQKRVIDDPESLEQLGVTFELLLEQRLLLRAKLELSTPPNPIEVLEHCPGVLSSLVFGIVSTDRGAFQVVRLVNIAVRREKVVHDEKVDFSPSRQLDSMEAVESAEEGMWVLLDVLVIVLEYLAQELVFGMVDRLDDETVVPRKVKEGTRFAGGPEFGENVFGGEREEIVGRVEVKVLSKGAKDPGSVVLELEVVLCRRRELVADAAGWEETGALVSTLHCAIRTNTRRD
jgi:hypothetical protein